MIEAMTWFEVNKKRLGIGAAVLLVVGFGVYVFQHMGHQNEVKASAALIALRAPVNAGTNQVPITAAQYMKVAQDFAGTDAAERAELLAAGALFSEGKYAESHAAFDKFLRDHPASEWAWEAAYGVASGLEAQGKQEEAVAAYQRVVTTYGGEPAAQQAKLALARIYEAKGKPEEALKIYEDLSKAAGGGMSMSSQQAMVGRERILKKNPQLAKPTTIAPAMTNAVNLPTASKPAGSTNK